MAAPRHAKAFLVLLCIVQCALLSQGATAAKPALRLRRSLMQDPSSPAPAPNAAAGNATPSPAPDASTPTPGADAAGAAGGGNATISSSGGSGSVFPGYPASGGLLHPELSNLLLAIQEAHLYKDSKTAVDLVLKQSVADTASQFQQLLQSNSSSSSSGAAAAGSGNATAAGGSNSSSGSSSSVGVDALREFVNRTMADAGSDMLTCQAVDWTPQPQGFLSNLDTKSTGFPTAAADGDGGAAGGSADGANATAGGGEGGAAANATELRQFGLELHQLWGLLCRKISPSVSANPERHSLLPLPQPTIVPGDRFRETYYWDSYWVIRGLLVSGMSQSATNLVSNLMVMLEAVGHVPNGGRVYYINRSQPPLLSAMVRAIVEAEAPGSSSGGNSVNATSGGNTTGTSGNAGSSNSSSTINGTELLQRALPLLVREHQYWTSAPKQLVVQAADGTLHNFSRYYANWTAPRPESYREDAELAVNVTGTSSLDNPAAAALYRDLAAGAESGWDYSSRWFADNKTLATIRTTQIIPADLNAFLYQMESNIAWAAEQLGQEDIQAQFESAAANRRASINKLLWDNAAGMWRDGILTPLNSSSGNSSSGNSGGNSSSAAVYTLTLNPGVFASNFVPLWAGLADSDLVQGGRVVEALNSSGLVQPAGIATTLYNTGQQWDMPNGWPPLQHMLTEGARLHGGSAGREFACRLERTWLSINMRVYNATGAMHEKYDVTTPTGAIGGGGEYAPQVGFGWSNGVALDFLSNYC